MRLFLSLLATLLVLQFSNPGQAESRQVEISAETGNTWFSRNDVRIPNEEGTTFNMLGITGRNGSDYYRFRISATFGEKHTFRLLAAPLQQSGSGEFAQPVDFEGRTFEAGTPTDGTYRFNTYRFTYRYTFYNRNDWTLGAGAAALLRDAKVELQQGELSESSTDLGFVPLVHLYAKRNLGNGFSLTFDAETLAGQQGRATDAALFANYAFSDQWSLNFGYRVLEGGADVGQIYNFAWINFAAVGLQFSL